MSRLPVYLLIDTSGSMKGEPIESVKVGLETMVSCLRRDPFALESVSICIITFDREVKCILPLTALEELQIPQINVPETGPTHTGAALEMLCECVDFDVRKTTKSRKGDWRPLLFIMTDGKPSDIRLYNSMIPEIKKRNFATIVACAAGMHAKIEFLKLLTNNVYSLDTIDQTEFIKFFKWVSDSIGINNRSMGATNDIVLPPIPDQINI